MRDTLADLVRQSAPLFDFIRVQGTDTETKISATAKSKTFFMEAITKEVIPEFAGECSVTNLGMLGSLLNFGSYKAEGSKFFVRRDHPTRDCMTSFELQDSSGKGAKFRTGAPENAGPKTTIGDLPWGIEIVPHKAKIAEFAQLGTLFNDVDVHFGLSTQDGNLIFSVGEDRASTHFVEIVFATGIEGEIRGKPQFPTKNFLSVLKMAGNNPVKLRISKVGVLAVEFSTEFATYRYYLRAKH